MILLLQKIRHHLNRGLFKKGIAPVILAFAAICSAKAGISLAFSGPSVFVDEYYYDAIAQMIASGQLFLGTLPYPKVPFPWGYPLVISIAYHLVQDKLAVYHVSLLINALLSSCIIFPAYGILKRFVRYRTAVLGSLLVAVLPSLTCPSFLLMSENLLTVLFLLSGWLILRYFAAPRGLASLSLGLVFILMYFTRTPALSMILAYVLVFGIFWWKKGAGTDTISGKGLMTVLLPVFGIFCIWIGDQVLIKGDALQGYSTGYYLHSLSQTLTHSPFLIAESALIHLNYLLLSSAVILSFTALLFVYRIIIEKRKDTTAVFFIGYVLFSSLFLLCFAVLHMIDPQWGLLCGRYVDPILPFIIIFGVIGLENAETGNYFHDTRMIGGLFLSGILCIILSELFPVFHAIPSPNSNSGILYLSALTSFFGADLPVILIPLVMTAGAFLCVTRKKLHLFLVCLLILAVLATIPPLLSELNASEYHADAYTDYQKMIPMIGEDSSVIWDTEANTDEGANIFYYQMKFWLKDRIVQRTADNQYISDIGNPVTVNPEKGVFLLTRKNSPGETMRLYNITAETISSSHG